MAAKKKKAAKKKAGKTKPVSVKVKRSGAYQGRADLKRWKGLGAHIQTSADQWFTLADRGWSKALGQDRSAKRTKQSWKKAVKRSRMQSGSSSTKVTWDGDN